MDLFTTKELQSLFDKRLSPCVSIFLPTHRAGREIRQDPIRLKNFLREAENRLLSLGLRPVDAKDYLLPAQALLGSEFFWRNQDVGLALFLSEDFFRHYRLPIEFSELAVVADRFQIKPLLPLFAGDGRFYVLAISQNQVKLFEGTRYTVSELELKGIPRSLTEALLSENPERHLQVRTLTAGGSRTAQFHGHGSGAEDSKEDLLRYFRQIDKGVRELLKDQRAPLVLAAVEYLQPIYREASTFPLLLDGGVPGSPDELSAQELHRCALPLARLHFEKAQQKALAQYRELLPTGRCSTDIREILTAAHRGRVEFAFVPVGVQQWGIFDPGPAEVTLHRTAEAGGEDLLNLISIYTILNRGSVYAVPPAEIPDGAPVAVLYRY